jgi:hypothetical protein
VDETMANRKVTLAGVVNYVRPHITRSSRQMAFAEIEDLQGSIELVIFPSTWEETKELWQPERILVVRGRVSLRGGNPNIIVDSATTQITRAQPAETSPFIEAETWAAPEAPPSPVDGPADETLPPPARLAKAAPASNGPVRVEITVPGRGDIIHRLGQVYALLQDYPGQDRVHVYVAEQGRRRMQIDFPNTGVGYCVELRTKLHDLLGRGRVSVERGI